MRMSESDEYNDKLSLRDAANGSWTTRSSRWSRNYIMRGLEVIGD